ncbi:winged helix-turn-helix domain-containing tetratricopeptide repeat protein [Pseudorhodoplanes sp.]|uniref:winged helix-turn-helix domain-containing tetratricopeptide repeat protein n=1 Tax=Pseudorhodoplanes sp. TaxID=1934341 RepID=UPI003D14ECFF
MSQDEVSFGRFRLDLHRRTLTCEGAPVVLKNKAFDILAVLASARGKLVTKDELMAKVWPGLVVEESNIQVHVSVLRKALGEERDQPVHLFTVSGRGYRLVGATASTMNTSKPDAVAAPAFSDRPSIVVLPFTNMSGDPEQDYFADGVAEDIITGLSRIKWLFVIARNSSFIYKGKAVDVRQVGCDLGVRYALEGSVRKSGDRVRIAAQLIETQSALQVWAERYDRRLGDIFDVQDEIAMSVISAIEPGLRRIELARIQRKRPDSLDAYDLVLQALPFVYKLMPAGSAPAIPLLQKALALEPDYSLAHATLAWCFHIRFGRGGLDAEDRRSAIHHAHAALSGAGDDATTLAISAFVIWFEEHDMAMAFDLFDRALSISSLNFVALCTSAVALAWSGKCELAIERARQALKLSPFDSMNHLSYQGLAGAYFQLGRHAEAYEVARRAVELNPGFSVPYAYLTAALIGLGRHQEARIAARSVLKLDPKFTINRFSVTVGVNPEVFSAFAHAWREAGLPESE